MKTCHFIPNCFHADTLRVRSHACESTTLTSGIPQVSLGASKEPKKAAINLLPKSKLGAAAAPKPGGSGGIFGGDFLTQAPPSCYVGTRGHHPPR